MEKNICVSGPSPKTGLIVFSVMFGFAVSMVSAPCLATTMRYALIIGNNKGVDNNGKTPFMPLKHAEKEAHKLKKKLVGLSNFAPDSNRTLLLTSASKNDVKSAITRLALQKKKDEQVLGKVESIFLFYFTGHGLQGRLLLSDGALYSKEIGKMFETVGADFAVGIFDACHSGSLSPKGVVPTPGLNMFKEMPKEVLDAKGRIWYVSSSAKQVSYEDNKIGGVFTHFFMEALTDAPKSGPGITLESIWNYAREKTVLYTAKQNKTQVPQQHISNLKSSAPVYFSFPQKRSATLLLSKALNGKFALSYANGQLTEIINKTRGKKKRVALYAGEVTLSYIEGDDVTLAKTFHVENGSELVLRTASDLDENKPLGHRRVTLWAKGTDDMQDLQLQRKTESASFLMGASYGHGVTANGVLGAGHMVAVPLRIDLPSMVISVAGGYASERREYGAWGYKTDGIIGTVDGGWALDFSSNRLSLGVDFEYMRLWQKFDSGNRKSSHSFSPAARVTWLFRKNNKLNAAVFIRAGAAYGESVSSLDQYFWAFTGAAGMSVYFRVI